MLHVILFVTLLINYGLDQKTRNLRSVINDYERAERASRICFFSRQNHTVLDSNDARVHSNDLLSYCFSVGRGALRTYNKM